MSKPFLDNLRTNSSSTKVYYLILSTLETLSKSELTELLDILELNYLVNHLETKFPDIPRKQLVETILDEYYTSNKPRKALPKISY
jgi:hypothetical protein